MSSNELKMTVEERIVQQIKSDSLLSIVGDEDAILELAQRAVREALFSARVITVKGSSYYGHSYEEKISPVMEAANDAAKKVCQDVAESIMKEMMEDKRVRDAINEALPAILIATLKTKAEGYFDNAVERAIADKTADLQSAIFQMRNG